MEEGEMEGGQRRNGDRGIDEFQAHSRGKFEFG